MNDSRFDVLVIGAGISGLIAACTLAESGRKVAIVEAKSRVGGRLHSERIAGCDLPVELGAEFVHGKPPELLELIARAGKTRFELDGRDLCFSQGKLSPCVNDGTIDVMEQLAAEDVPNRSFDRSFLEWIAEKQLPPGVARSAISYVEGFNAADARRIGTASLARQQRAEDAIEGNFLFRIEEGYSSIADYLQEKFTRDGGRIFLSAAVHTIQWQPEAVRIDFSDLSGGRDSIDAGPSRSLQAAQCVITLPLGVLQSGSIQFDPVPERTMTAVNQMAMGTAKRVTFVFHETFWAARFPDTSFLLSPGDIPGIWWTPNPNPCPMLTGWIGGPRAQSDSIAGGQNLLDAGLYALGKLFSTPETEIRRRLVSWHFHDWEADVFSRGAYSYVPKGALQASATMSEPVHDTLFFAGEHTDVTDHWGTVHGALASGLRAAGQVRSRQER